MIGWVEEQQILIGSKAGFEDQPQHANLSFANKYVGYKSDRFQVSLNEVQAEVIQLEDIDQLMEFKNTNNQKRLRQPGFPSRIKIDRVSGAMTLEDTNRF